MCQSTTYNLGGRVSILILHYFSIKRKMATHLQLPPVTSRLQLHKFVTGLKDCV